LKEWRHDPVVVLLGNALVASDSVINDGVVFLQQTLELTELFSTEVPETLIGKGTDQQIGLARAVMPGAKWELATERLERSPIVRHWERGRIGCRASWHGF
jgi:hypothetical protein